MGRLGAPFFSFFYETGSSHKEGSGRESNIAQSRDYARVKGCSEAH
jgi:hypothetical protein